MYTFFLAPNDRSRGKGEAVQGPETEIIFSPEARDEFEAIQRTARPLVRDWARRCLEELTDFPPEAWADLRRSVRGTFFKSDPHIPFDIQGAVFEGPGRETLRVVVTRFRSRREA